MNPLSRHPRPSHPHSHLPAPRTAAPAALSRVARVARGALLALTSLFTLLTACGPSDPAGSSGSAPRASDAAPRPLVALIMKSLANEFFLTMENGARAHQKAHAADYDLLANGIKDELDVARQIDMVEQMIARKVSAIVIAPADSKALVAACKKARDAGIVVVNIDNKLDDAVLAEKQLRIPFVGPDNRKGARAVGEHLARQLKPGDPVAVLEGPPNAFNGQQRRLGLHDALNAAGLKIVSSQPAHWETDQANRITAAILTEHPDLKAVLASNDSMALGAVAALRAAGRLDHVLVTGFDNIGAVQTLLREGRILATADQHADQIAVFGIEHALQILKIQTPPADKETPVDLIVSPSR